MTVKTRPEEVAEISLADVRVPWATNGMFWGPECPVNKAHGALIDIKGSSVWFCRHQEHDVLGQPARFDEEQLQRLAYEKQVSGYTEESSR